MQRAFERASDRGNRGLESAQQRPPKRKSSSTEVKSLHEKLYDIYVEECGKEPHVTEELTRNGRLLEKLVRRESLPHLLVNLLPGEKRFSLLLRVQTEVYSEIVLLPYEERAFLQYLDKEELSPDLIDILEKSQVDIFQSGCVIAQVRDYRLCADADCSDYQSRHILLRPTTQTSASDIQSISSDNELGTQEDELALENQPILATAEPLGPDPSVSVACTENKLLYNPQKMDTPPTRSLQGDSAASLNPQPEEPCDPPPPEVRAEAPDQNREEGQADQLHDDAFKERNFADIWEQITFDLEGPPEMDMDRYAKENRFDPYDDAQPTVWPNVEAENNSLYGYDTGHPSQTTRPSIMRSLNDPFISGQISGEEVRREGQMSHLHSTDDYSYSSVPGSKTGPAKAAGQAKEVGKKRICPVRVPQGSRGFTNICQLSPGRAAEQPQAASVPSAALGKGGQRTPPASSRPGSSGNGSLAKPLPSQQASQIPAFPSQAPACQPPNLPKKPPVEAKRGRTSPTATVSTASASRITPHIQIKTSRSSPSADPKVIQVIGPVRVVRTVVRESTPAQASPNGARAPSGVKPNSPPSAGQPPNAGPAAPQASSQEGVQYALGNLSSIKPINVLWVPKGSDISSILPQGQQPQQLVCQVYPQPPLQQPSSSQEPVVRVFKVHIESSSQPKRQSAQQAAATNVSGAGGVVQPQRAQLSQPGSAQVRPGQNPAQQLFPVPAASQELPEPEPMQWEATPVSEAVATASVQPAQPGKGQ